MNLESNTRDRGTMTFHRDLMLQTRVLRKTRLMCEVASGASVNNKSKLLGALRGKGRRSYSWSVRKCKNTSC